ncbi:HNH endonuclease [Mycolicibacterium rufum]|uniref:HNH endonuclease n=1 Tax=Mycolicibacterium rufum TaxID=318424 RepID=A0A9X2YDG9_9MYCO|nr:HNH endonuclease signature motif containing protein [Mycolicibacterium rufum]MCV7071280.1 HNH endonuclease [Mycolicibacterium rufum]ULP37335.1 HNH endonuclease [Mycolicibacterium rufum]
MIADPHALDATPDPQLHGEPAPTSKPKAKPEPTPTPEPQPEPAIASTPEPEPEKAVGQPSSDPAANPGPADTAKPRPIPAGRPVGVIPGFGLAVVPAPLLAELIAHGATVRFTTDPAALTVVDGYRPSAALDRFVRSRDLTCRFPGCDRPAEYADIDHTNPYPYGLTHPSNTKCYCRQHHLVKTFWEGFTDTQSADGTVHLSTPTGHTYTTTPFSTLLFPTWNTTTPPPPQTAHPTPPRHPRRNQLMPTRRHTRDQNRAAYIRRERELNALQRHHESTAHTDATRQTPPPDTTPSTPDYGDDPPPF